MATLGMSAADKDAVERFQREVVEPSMTKLVILDFWAEWCGPCKQLGPVLEKVAAAYAAKGVVLVKIDVDEQKFIAAQFRVKSIPTVYALFQGQPVADLTPARTESQLTQYLDQLLRQLPVQAGADDGAEDVGPLIAMGEQVLEGGDAARAASIFAQLADMAPDNLTVAAGHARALLALGEVDAARAALAHVPADVHDAGIAQARAALALAEQVGPVGETDALAARVAADADDQEARYELAAAHMAAGDRDAAADLLLGSIERDRAWNEEAARKRLLTLFEATGLTDPWVSAQRRRLSAVLFG